jgi:hypothetical protein
MMIPTTDSLWPYVLITGFWVVVCGWLLWRALRMRSRFRLAADGVTLLPERRSPGRMQDSQAGRI